MKALCSERFTDWSTKFEPFGLRCKEVTGDSELDDYYELQNIHIIMTTPVSLLFHNDVLNSRHLSAAMKMAGMQQLCVIGRNVAFNPSNQLPDFFAITVYHAKVSRLLNLSAWNTRACARFWIYWIFNVRLCSMLKRVLLWNFQNIFRKRGRSHLKYLKHMGRTWHLFPWLHLIVKLYFSSYQQEKWDSMTRKWRDNRSLVQSVKLFLIDEVRWFEL